jgi:thermitase
MKRFLSGSVLVVMLSLFAGLPVAFAQSRDLPKAVESAEHTLDLAAPAVPGQFLSQFKPSTTKANRSSSLNAIGAIALDRVDALDIEVIEVAQLKQADTVAARQAILDQLLKDPAIVSAEPNFIYSTTYTPNDPNQSSQWAWGVINAYQAWDVTRGSSSTVVAVVDTGIQANHPDLDAKVVLGYDYIDNDNNPADGNGHGTHVAGTVAAETSNSTGGAGTCPECKVLAVRVLNNQGSGSLDVIAKGITYAANNGAKVINLSLGGPHASTMENAVNYAWGKGSFLACAAGNSNTSSTAKAYPAAYNNCFAIASTTSWDARSSFSNYGTWVEVAAPGSDIYSTWLGSGYKTINGTSMATPHVAGLAGLLSSKGLNNSQIKAKICSSADKISGTGSAWTCGRINILKAVQ